MHPPDWYLIAYDIRDPRRLQRLHRALGAEALAVQRSVFLVAASVPAVECLLDRLETLIDPHLDDLRAYPVAAPDELWLSGPRPLQGGLLGDDVPAPAPGGQSDAPAWRQRLSRPVQGPTPARAIV